MISAFGTPTLLLTDAMKASLTLLRLGGVPLAAPWDEDNMQKGIGSWRGCFWGFSWAVLLMTLGCLDDMHLSVLHSLYGAIETDIVNANPWAYS